MNKFLNFKSLIVCLLLVTISDQSLYAASGQPDLTKCYIEILEKRHSGYAYNSKKPVTTEQLKALAAAASLSPSSYNEQPWIFIFCDKNSHSEFYEKAFNCLVPLNQDWAKNAPVLVVIAANKKSDYSESNRWAEYDTGASALNMSLKATSLGLMAHEMGGFDEVKIRKEFSLPDHVTPMAVMAVGYEVEGAPRTPRVRKPVNDNFFLGSYGQGLDK